MCRFSPLLNQMLDSRAGRWLLALGLALLRLEVAALRRHLAWKAGFDPEQPRDDHGRWTETGAIDGDAGADAGEGRDDPHDPDDGVPHYELVL